jgi:hypothetical protein
MNHGRLPSDTAITELSYIPQSADLEQDDPWWDEAGLLRRDCEPQRSALLRGLATTSLICGVLSWLLILPALIGLPCGVAALLMAERDLEKMRAGCMDNRAIGLAEYARQRAQDGIALNAPLWACNMLLLVYFGARTL